MKKGHFGNNLFIESYLKELQQFWKTFKYKNCVLNYQIELSVCDI